ncbi:MAG: carboxypeptidase-like regulatory domain-containing protein [Candidatus Kapaibacterium sp.]
MIYYNGTELHGATTTDNGSVRFDGLCMGNYRITINHDGYSQGVIEFSEECNATHGFTKSLLSTSTNTGCDTASLTIHVRDSLHQDTNLSGATVTIRIDGHSDNFTSGTTTDGGYYYSDHNLPGHTTYIVTISKDGYTTKSFSVQVGDCKNYGELIYLSPQ